MPPVPRRRAPGDGERLATIVDHMTVGSMRGSSRFLQPVAPARRSTTKRDQVPEPVQFMRDVFTLTESTPLLQLTYLPLPYSEHCYNGGFEMFEGVEWSRDPGTSSIQILSGAGVGSGSVIEVRYAWKFPAVPASAPPSELAYSYSDSGWTGEFGSYLIDGEMHLWSPDVGPSASTDLVFIVVMVKGTSAFTLNNAAGWTNFYTANNGTWWLHLIYKVLALGDTEPTLTVVGGAGYFILAEWVAGGTALINATSGFVTGPDDDGITIPAYTVANPGSWVVGAAFHHPHDMTHTNWRFDPEIFGEAPTGGDGPDYVDDHVEFRAGDLSTEMVDGATPAFTLTPQPDYSFPPLPTGGTGTWGYVLAELKA